MPAKTNPQCYDQGVLGSCTANGIAYCYQYDELKQKQADVFMPSRLFIYYNERLIEGTVAEDAGAIIRDGIKVMNRYGVCPEPMWPYVIDRFAELPPIECYTRAKQCTCVAYYSVKRSINSIKTALLSGFPIVFGFDVYESFESITKTGLMPVPAANETLLGGHCVVAVGYDDAKHGGSLIVRNSWGPSWGDNGHFYMPYSCISGNMTADFWVMSKISGDAKK